MPEVEIKGHNFPPTPAIEEIAEYANLSMAIAAAAANANSNEDLPFYNTLVAITNDEANQLFVIVNPKQRSLLYLKLQKAFHGMLKSALLFMKDLSKIWRHMVSG